MKKLFIGLALFASFSSSSQELIDVAGEWRGTGDFLKANFFYSVSLEQEGSQLSGFSFQRTLDGEDSAKFIVSGIVDGSTVKIYPQKIAYRTDGSCMSNVVLEFEETGSSQSLLGKWKGDLRLNTCPPGVSGNIKLYRKKVTYSPTNQVQASVPVNEVIQTDDVGNALVNELAKRKYYALLIGVNEYGDESIQRLDQPIGDAQRLATVLSQQYTFEQSEMTLLQNPDRTSIIEALDDLSRKVTEKDNLLVFYAGHGIWNEQLNQGYWLPSDAKANSKSQWISNSTIRDYLGGIKSKHTLLISDACFSGGILKERAVFENSRAILELYKLPSRKAMTSGTLKTVPDESVFIEYLVKNLQTNNSPLLSADQLFRNFKIAVINNSPNGQVPQYGPITQAGDEGGDFIFLRRN